MAYKIELQASLKGVAINTGLAIFLYAILLAILSENSGDWFQLRDYVLFGAISLGVVLAYVLGMWVYQASQLNKRSRQIKALASQKGWRVLGVDAESAKASKAAKDAVNRRIAVGLLTGGSRPGSKNHVHTSDWSYCDYSYMVKNRYDGRSYDMWRVHYAVISTKLPRKLPHVIFDSNKSRGRQFRFIIDANQRHSLEGNFDEYFTTYFPKQYHVDSLSFITPDVMQAMMKADDYDIEILDDQLFLYGSLSDPDTQIEAMAEKLAAIKKELLDNILTYRDERLAFDAGRQTVDVKGQRLANGTFMAICFLIYRVLVLAFMTYWSFVTD